MTAQARRGLTLIELLVVMFIVAILMAFIATVLINIGGEPRKRKAMADIAKIGLALSEYENCFGEYPPDTGYGLRREGEKPRYARKVKGVFANVPTYDPGSLWRYLCRRVADPKTGEPVGPFLEEWPQSQLARYNDPYENPSWFLTDPWGNPYAFVGDRRRVVHNHGSFDIFSAGPDGVTACNNGRDDPPVGSPTPDEVPDPSDDPTSTAEGDNRAYNTDETGSVYIEIDDDGNGTANDSTEFGPEAIRNGDIGDDVNNWISR